MRRMISFFAFAFMATLMCIGQPVVIDGITYSLYNNEAFIESASPNISGNLTIPRSITNKGKDYKVVSIKLGAFKDCSKLTSINTSGVEYIGDYAFENCTGLTDITMPTVLSELGYGAFEGCYNLQSVDIPIIRSDWGGVVTIKRNTFSGCKSLVFVKIPFTIKQIEDWAFKDCTSLTDIFLMSTNKPYLYYNAFGGVNKKQIKIHVYQNALSNYENSEWNEFGGIDTNMSEPKIQKQRLPQNSHTTTSDAVDMGGSVEWATKNLEASSPEEPGGIFAWGETTSKSRFSPSNYSAPVIPGKYAYEKYEIGLRGNKYDAARVKLGAGWRMPSEEEFKELLRNCKQVLHNRENYVELIAPNGNTLKLPYIPNTNITYDGIEHFYWTLDMDSRGPRCIYFSEATYSVGYGNGHTHFISKNMEGHYGGLIRPVRNKGKRVTNGGNYREDLNNNEKVETTKEETLIMPTYDELTLTGKDVSVDEQTRNGILNALKAAIKRVSDAQNNRNKEEALGLYYDAWDVFNNLYYAPETTELIDKNGIVKCKKFIKSEVQKLNGDVKRLIR